MALKAYSQIEMQAAPTANAHLVRKQDLDAITSGLLDPKETCKGATAAVLDATYSGVGKTLIANTLVAFTSDSVTWAATNRVLVKNQAGANRTENGIYTITTLGENGVTAYVLTRATDFDSTAEITQGAYCAIAEGTANAKTWWLLTTVDPIVLDTSLLIFESFPAIPTYTAGDGIDIAAYSVAVDVTDIIDTTKGLTEDTNNIQVNITASEGLDFNGVTGALEVDVTDFIDTSYGLTEDTNNIRVKVESDGGIQFDAVNYGLEIKLDGTSLSVGASGLKQNSFTQAIVWDGAGPYTETILAATHGLGATKNLNVTVYENDSKVLVDKTVTSAGLVTITSDVNFANGSVFIN